jgi:hypothetical protein
VHKEQWKGFDSLAFWCASASGRRGTPENLIRRVCRLMWIFYSSVTMQEGHTWVQADCLDLSAFLQ